MSWSEVFKINKNMKRALNEQMRDAIALPMRVITVNTTYTPEKTGLYKVICVGKGGNSGGQDGSYSYDVYAGSGGGGGVAISTLKLLSSQSYNVTANTTASFGNILTAYAGGAGAKNVAGSGGGAEGGDFNFSGGSGNKGTSANVSFDGGGVGVAIVGLSRKIIVHDSKNDYHNVDVLYGESILSYGAGAPASIYRDANANYYCSSRSGLPAAVIIIPLEMEE